MNAESDAVLQDVICETKREIMGVTTPLGSPCHKKPRQPEG